jgi:hypothetical protein
MRWEGSNPSNAAQLFRAVLARAKFAACVYGESDDALGEIYASLPDGLRDRLEPKPTNTAYALAGYVTLRGTEPGQPMDQARKLAAKSKFWKQVSSRWKSEADYVCDTLQKSLTQLKIDQTEAAEIAELFRKKLSSRFGF